MNQAFIDALNQLMSGSGISNNELARRIEVDAAQVGRWRKGRGRPRPENLVRAAQVFGVDYKWLWSLAYPEGVPSQGDVTTLDPRLSAFLAEVEVGWRAMDDSAERDMAERVTRSAFKVADIRKVDGGSRKRSRRPLQHHVIQRPSVLDREPDHVTNGHTQFGRDNDDRLQQKKPRKNYYVRQSVTEQIKQYGLAPLIR